MPSREDSPSERTADITFVVPSHNRRAALRQNLPALLELWDVLEVIVVIDRRSDDGTEEMVREEFGANARVRLLRQAKDGLSSARNAGCAIARGEWIVISDDDLRYPPDYGPTLKRVAREQHADIVGAPWLNITEDDMEGALAAARARRGGVPTIDDHSVVPQSELETPFMPAQGESQCHSRRRGGQDHLPAQELPLRAGQDRHVPQALSRCGDLQVRDLADPQEARHEPPPHVPAL